MTHDPATIITEAIETLEDIKWHSAHKDNMEFSTVITYYQWQRLDNLLARLRALAVTPPTEAAALERSAQMVEDDDYWHFSDGTRPEVAAAIRALKQPAESSAA